MQIKIIPQCYLKIIRTDKISKEYLSTYLFLYCSFFYNGSKRINVKTIEVSLIHPFYLNLEVVQNDFGYNIRKIPENVERFSSDLTFHNLARGFWGIGKNTPFSGYLVFKFEKLDSLFEGKSLNAIFEFRIIDSKNKIYKSIVNGVSIPHILDVKKIEVPKHIAYKYCFEKYNPLNGCRTIKLGSTGKFRKEFEKDQYLINDPLEGISCYLFGDYFRIGKSIPDNYVFCVSNEKIELSDTFDAFGIAYNSFYKINDLNSLRLYLLELLKEQLKPKDFIEDQQKLVAENFHKIIVWHNSQPVIYDTPEMKKPPKSIKILNETSFERYIATNYYKTLEYTAQKESRIIFVPFIPETSIINPNDINVFDEVFNQRIFKSCFFLDVAYKEKILTAPNIIDFIE